MAAKTGGKKKADMKVVIMGDFAIGKTALLQRYISGAFQDTTSTIGASFMLKQWGPYNIAIWDTAGNERYSGLTTFMSGVLLPPSSRTTSATGGRSTSYRSGFSPSWRAPRMTASSRSWARNSIS
ncbi:phagosome acidification [Branchiostoma belcheri]|nr:phagosome acidification [Branchiostoma belcheri]